MRSKSFFNKIGQEAKSASSRWSDMTPILHANVSGGAGNAALDRSSISNIESGFVPQGQNLIPADLKLPGHFYLKAKRVFDVLVAVLALGVFGLFLPLIALLIKIDSPGPIFYSQERVGINRRQKHRRNTERHGHDRRKVLRPGKPFKVYKLRSMRTDAESKGAQLAVQNDSRVTRMGRFIRKTRIDEIPQFLNVLQGEMSLIGPRPERLIFVHQLEKDIPDFRDRLLVKPGITGLAQVINGYDDGVESARRKIELDKRYINNAGWRQDARILVSTVSVVLKGEGAL